ncbi:HNH endonuclease [Paraclostridium sordellii]|uniref:HNH endonuclease n=1 Tax=Paraclostridium sordellii TaxID=1505 RepID=UPI0005DD6AD0|nr:HNH endonuclease [Paeniclostridium sordellii]CEP39694.1 Gp54 protein [[Clostridium] sordellii] [Paeniclostridium sordellii]
MVIILYTLCKDCNTKIPYGTTRCTVCASKREEYLKYKSKKYNADRYDRDKVNEDVIRLFYTSTAWKNKRAEIVRRDNNECQICKALYKFVPSDDVHHIVPMTKDFSKRLDNNNLISLCSYHHKQVHLHSINNEEQLTKYVKQLINSDKFYKKLVGIEN